MLITPAILAKDEREFRDRICFVHQLPSGRWHIDILDGTKYHATCWHDAHVIADIPNLPDIELHLMVTDPFVDILAWHRATPKLKRVLIESDAFHLENILRQVQALNLEVSLVLNPDQKPDICAPYVNSCDEILIMGIVPGASGKTFLGEEIYAKIARTRALFPSIDIAIDGGVTEQNIGLLAQAGVMRAVCASALWKSPSPSDAQRALQEASKIVL